MNLLPSIVNFLSYFGSAAVSMLVFALIYIGWTPYNEFKEIRDKHNTAAAIALSGALIGYALPEASLLIHAVSLFDFFMWSGVALMIQLFAFCVSLIFRVQERIANGDISAAIMLASISIVAGILNAASLTY